MESNFKNLACEFEAEIVSYLYDELAAANRDRFESHLIDCTPCTDEFAELSFSRFSVFEWQKEEFAPLNTPTISIPYPTRGVEAVDSAGFFPGVRELLGFNWQTGVTVAGILAICIGISFAVISFNGTGTQEIAAVAVKKEIPKTVSSTVASNVPPTVVVGEQEHSIDLSRAKTVRASQPTKITAELKKSKPVRTQMLTATLTSDNVAERMPATRRQTPPALTTEADDVDRSLRLTDLFDDDDTRL